MKLKAVIFDLDGVIVSTDECHYKAWKQMADEENIYFDKEINKRLRGVSRMESLSIILERSKKDYTLAENEELATRKNNYYRELIQQLTPNDILPGVMDVLSELKSNNIKIAIGSSSKNTSMILERIGLDTYFDAVADGTQISNSKPDPEVFLLAAEMLDISPANCLVVEDADAGVEAAIAGNMKVLGIGTAATNPKAHYTAKDLTNISLLKILNND
jgi:beta-phosphoglucomutase